MSRRPQSVTCPGAVTLGLGLFAMGCSLKCPDGRWIRQGVEPTAVRARYGMPDAVAEGSEHNLRFWTAEGLPENCRAMAVTEYYYLDANARFHFETDRLMSVSPLGSDSLRSVVERQVELRAESKCRSTETRQ